MKNVRRSWRVDPVSTLILAAVACFLAGFSALFLVADPTVGVLSGVVGAAVCYGWSGILLWKEAYRLRTSGGSGAGIWLFSSSIVAVSAGIVIVGAIVFWL